MVPSQRSCRGCFSQGGTAQDGQDRVRAQKLYECHLRCPDAENSWCQGEAEDAEGEASVETQTANAGPVGCLCGRCVGEAVTSRSSRGSRSLADKAGEEVSQYHSMDLCGGHVFPLRVDCADIWRHGAGSQSDDCHRCRVGHGTGAGLHTPRAGAGIHHRIHAVLLHRGNALWTLLSPRAVVLQRVLLALSPLRLGSHITTATLDVDLMLTDVSCELCVCRAWRCEVALLVCTVAYIHNTVQLKLC
mmetsp:Transcript_9842/g.23914  ORF Transcript_9842/g.23914 Transcript_9842/m.23914 type:complete len:246 (+) Transcript_9842:667-1404(+)